ncbi:MAG: response regulator transcription factor [Terriglobia bacterium]
MITLLSDRELSIVQRIVGGYSNNDIAQDLEMSEQAVKRHVFGIFKRLGVSSRLELALYAVHSGCPE